MKNEKLYKLLQETKDEDALAYLFLTSNDICMHLTVVNDHCPVWILELASKHKSPIIRNYVVCNNKCPLKVLEVLARTKDENLYIRENIAEHLNCSIELLKELCKDNNVTVRRTAQRNLQLKLLEQK